VDAATRRDSVPLDPLDRFRPSPFPLAGIRSDTSMTDAEREAAFAALVKALWPDDDLEES
jgi:hypothetical protein